MKVKLINEPITEEYTVNLLKARGVEDINTILNPSEIQLLSPTLLSNIEKGAAVLYNTLMLKGSILIIVD